MARRPSDAARDRDPVTQRRARRRRRDARIAAPRSNRSSPSSKRSRSAAGAKVLDRVVQRRDAVDPATLVGSGKAREIAERAREAARGPALGAQRLASATAQESREDRPAADRRSHDADSRRLRAPRAQPRGKAASRARAAALSAVEPDRRRRGSLATGRRHRHARSRRDQTRSRPAPHRRAHRRPAPPARRGAASARGAAHRRRIASRSSRSSATPTSASRRCSTRSRAATPSSPISPLPRSIRRFGASTSEPGTYVRLADTVGFITDLPKDLVNAFRATLEELREADLSGPRARCKQSAMAASAPGGRRDSARARARSHAPAARSSTSAISRSRRRRTEPGALCVSATTGEGLDASAQLALIERAARDVLAKRRCSCDARAARSASAGCARNADDAFVASVQRLRPAVVLLSMRVPPENKKDRYDDAYATGFVVASGAVGKRHTHGAARDRRCVGPSRHRWQPLAGACATRRVERRSRSRAASHAATAASRRSRSGSSSHLQDEVGEKSVCSAIRFPMSSTTKGSA